MTAPNQVSLPPAGLFSVPADIPPPDRLALSLARWTDVSRRLLPRIRLRAGCGPLARPFGRHLAIDIAVSVTDTIRPTSASAEYLIAVDRHMVSGWGRPGEEIRSTALANLARESLPAAIAPSPELPGLRIVSGSVWATGLVIDTDLLVERFSVERASVGLGSAKRVMVGIGSESILLVAFDQEAEVALPGATELLGEVADDPLPATVEVLGSVSGR